MTVRCAILDDYQNAALTSADWSPVSSEIATTVFDKPIGDENAVIAALKDFTIVCAMRERTRFSRRVIEGLPNLKLLITTGMRNASIDIKAANERGVAVCGTGSTGNPTVGIAVGLMLELTRRIGFENARMKAGQLWQTTIGTDVEGKTLGCVGLGKLGSRVAKVAQALGMKTIAWSQNLTAEKAREAGAEFVEKDELFRRADVVTVHLVLSDRSRGLIGARELGLMKPTAFIINTARGPIIDEEALVTVLRNRRIAGAGLDVFDTEPLPLDHPLRKLENVVLTPHLGYVSAENYEVYFRDTVDDIRGFLDGSPRRIVPAG
jgi:phosphoglycerate dehydrogenase-like enzyme